MKREGIDIRAGRLDEAAEWLLRLEQPSRTEADYTDWLRWCDAVMPQRGAACEVINFDPLITADRSNGLTANRSTNRSLFS